MDRFIAELFGTFVLVFVGVGAIVTGGFGGELPLGQVGIGLAFGLAVTAMAYTVGPISGAHLNPAVTVGVWLSGRMETDDVLPYIAAQVIGAIVGAAAVYGIATGQAGGVYDVATNGLGQTTWEEAGGNGTAAALAVEFLATFVFVAVILSVTNPNQQTALAGLVIGLTLAILHFAFIPVSGNSLNPARSIGPALFVGADAISQLWLYILAPLAGGAAAGLASTHNFFNVVMRGRDRAAPVKKRATRRR